MDIREMNLELEDDDDNDVRIRYRMGADVPESIDEGTVLAWNLIIWVEDEESYRVEAVLDGEEWRITLFDILNGEESMLDDDPDIDDEELEIEFLRDRVERLRGPFTWAAWTRFVTGNDVIFGDNVPDAGDMFVEMPEPDQRHAFPE